MRLTRLRLVLLSVGVVGVFAFAAQIAHRTHLGRSHLEIAQRELQQGRLGRAERAARQGLMRQPKNRALWVLLLQIRVSLHGSGRVSESHPGEEAFLAFIGKSPFEDLTGRYFFYLGRPERALAHLTGPDPNGRLAMARGDLALLAGKRDVALAEYRAAVKAAPNAETVEALFRGLEQSGRRSAIADYLRQDSVLRVAPPRHQVDGHLLRGDFIGILQPLLLSQRESYRLLTVLVGLLAGIGWLVLLLQIGRVSSWGSLEVALIVPALLLGALSAQATLWAASVADFLIGYDHLEKTFVVNALYAVLGIGLREETLKLLFFAPLLPFVARIREDRELRTLVLASLVGLGFAVEENIGYFGQQPGGVFARFLTANFFHMTLTGLAGRHLLRALQKPGRAADDLEVLAMVVVLHGLYDFLLMERSLAELSWLAYTVYIWVAHRFLNEVLILGGRQKRSFPLSYTFIISLAVSVGAGYFLATVRAGPLSALGLVAGGIIGTAIITVLFFREFGEPMSHR